MKISRLGGRSRLFRRRAWCVLSVMLGLLGASVHAADLTVDDFETPELHGWNIWQPNNTHTFVIKRVTDQPHSGSGCIYMNMKDGGGLVQKGVDGAAWARQKAEGISFWIRAGSSSPDAEALFSLTEKKSRESFYCVLKLTDVWQQVRIPFKDLKIFPWGGSPIDNGTLDIDQIEFLKFAKGKGNFDLYVDDIMLYCDALKADNLAQENAAAAPTVEVVIPALDDGPARARPVSEYPAAARNLRIAGNQFVREGKPVFLLGGWQIDHESHPWLLNLLAMDTYTYNAADMYVQHAPKIVNHRMMIEKTSAPWYEAWLHREVNNGLLYWHEMKMKTILEKELPDIVPVGHFANFDPLNPIGQELYDSFFKIWMRYTRKYPMFAYELFNEVEYHNTKRTAQQEFRQKMMSKYKTIAAANAIWGTNFVTWTDMVPPGFIGISAKAQLGSAQGAAEQRQAKLYPNLWQDWIKYQEDSFEQISADLMVQMRANDPRPTAYNTIQSPCQLFLDYQHAGVRPTTIAKVADFYSHEVGLTVFPNAGHGNDDQVKNMLIFPMTCDVVKNACPDKPIFDAESPISVSRKAASEDQMALGDMAKLHSDWIFFDGTAQEPAHWYQPDFSASSWRPISVPGMWGKSGFAQCKVGLYRRTFTLTAAQLQSPSLYLNAKNLCDKAEIYLNGERLYTTSKWDETVCLNLKSRLKPANTLAIRVENTYFNDGMYYGGIRGYIHLNTFAGLSTDSTLMPGYYRTHIWEQLVHGLSGDMICYGNGQFAEAARVIPLVRQEIASVDQIVLPRPRIKGKVALVYPFETFRGIYHESYEEMLRHPASQDYLNFYGSLLWYNCGLDVISNQDILAGRADGYAAIIMTQNHRVPANVVSRLDAYVRNGGTLLGDMRSCTQDDDTHQPVDSSALWGVSGGALNASLAAFSFKDAGLTHAPMLSRYIDGMARQEIKPTTARVIAKCDDGSPALTLKNSGSGHAYYLAVNTDLTTTRAILSHVLTQAGVRPVISATTADHSPSLVETQLLTHESRRVLYAVNWGQAADVRLAWADAPDGLYTVRDVITSQTLKSPQGTDTWNAAALREGITMNLQLLSPAILLIEPANIKPLVLQGISPTRHDMLEKLWRLPEPVDVSAETPLRVAITPQMDGVANGPLPVSFTPTADALLAATGCKVVHYDSSLDLSQLDVIVWSCPDFPSGDPKKLVEFVERGGGLILMGTAMTNWHENNGTKQSQLLWNAFNARVPQFTWLATDHPLPGDDLLRVHCGDFAASPVAQGVKQFVSTFANAIDCKYPGAQTLLSAPADCNLAGKPLMVEITLGKGKVLIMGDAWWLKPYNIELGDNPQLWVNMIRHVGGRSSMPLTAAQKKAGLFITRQRMDLAQKQEADGLFDGRPITFDLTGKIKNTNPWNRDRNYEDPITNLLE